jgi:putative phage-type endonuclease
VEFGIMSLAILNKTPEWHAERATGIGASDAGKIMSGDWHALWLEKTGRYEPEDLSGNLAVQMGSFTEPLNIFWFERATGNLIHDNSVSFTHPIHTFMRATLDGRTMFPDAVFEAKHVSAFAKDDEIVTRYYPQLQHQMFVTSLPSAFLSVFFGNSKYAYFEVAADPEYQADLVTRCAEFWRHVTEDIEPANQAAQGVAVAFDQLRTVDMTGNNLWSSMAADWLANKAAAKTFETASKSIKEMIEADVGTATGHGIKVSRNKAGSLAIKEI